MRGWEWPIFKKPLSSALLEVFRVWLNSDPSKATFEGRAEKKGFLLTSNVKKRRPVKTSKRQSVDTSSSSTAKKSRSLCSILDKLAKVNKDFSNKLFLFHRFNFIQGRPLIWSQDNFWGIQYFVVIALSKTDRDESPRGTWLRTLHSLKESGTRRRKRPTRIRTHNFLIKGRMLYHCAKLQ